MAEGGKNGRVYAAAGLMRDRQDDQENLLESFVTKMENIFETDEDNFDYCFVVEFLRSTFSMLSCRYYELLGELTSVDFDKKFKRLIREREEIHGWVQGLKIVYREGYFRVDVEDESKIEKEIERQEGVLEEMLETAISCWSVEKDLAQPLNGDLPDFLF